MLRKATIPVVLFGGIVLVFLILPNLIIVPVSFSPSEYYQEFPPRQLSLRWYERLVADARWLDAFTRSLRIGVATMALSVVVGTGTAFALARGRLPGQKAVLGLVLAPLVVPHIILAAGLYVLYVRIGLVNTEIGIVLAHTVIAMPLVVVAVMASLRGPMLQLEQAAMSLGATYLQAFVRVALPLVRPGIVTGGILAFITSFDELILVIFLGGVRSITVPLKMWEGVTVESNPVLPAASTVLVIISSLCLCIVQFIRRRGTSGVARAARP